MARRSELAAAASGSFISCLTYSLSLCFVSFCRFVLFLLPRRRAPAAVLLSRSVSRALICMFAFVGLTVKSPLSRLARECRALSLAVLLLWRSLRRSVRAFSTLCVRRCALSFGRSFDDLCLMVAVVSPVFAAPPALFASARALGPPAVHFPGWSLMFVRFRSAAVCPFWSCCAWSLAVGCFFRRRSCLPSQPCSRSLAFVSVLHRPVSSVLLFRLLYLLS